MVVGIVAPFYISTVRSLFNQLYDFVLENVPQFILDISKREFEIAFEFGKRIGILISCWFLVLFSMELVIRIVLGVIFFVVRLFSGRHSSEVPPENSEMSPKLEATNGEDE